MSITAWKKYRWISCDVAGQYDEVRWKNALILNFFKIKIDKTIKSKFFFRLLNLLKQYGGLEEEYSKLNTPAQNEQQLKNFDLSEYRQVIFTTVIVLHQQIIQQIQDTIKMHIVPAILDYDEMARGKQKGKDENLMRCLRFFPT